MNKRQAKKKLKKTMLYIKKYARKDGVNIIIKSQDFVDKNGKSCDPNQEDARFITLKRPKYIIKKYK